MQGVESRGRILTFAVALATIFWMAACSPAMVVPETPLPLAWQTQVSNDINRPTVSDDLVFVVDDSGKLFALNLETGTKQWEADLKQSNHGDDPVGIEEGTLFAMAQGDVGQVLAFDAQSGAQRWEVISGPSRHGEHPIAHEGVVYFEATAPDAMTASLRAVDAATGALVWDFPIGSYIATSPMVSTDLIYVGAYNFDGPSTKTRTVFALDPATGEMRWTYSSDLDLSGKFALDDDHLYIGADGGLVIARDAATGGPAWTSRVDGRLSNSPTEADGLVYVGTKDGEFIALNAADGTPRWRLAVDSPILTQATVAEGVVYFGTNDGYLHAVDARTGEEKWKIESPLRESIGAPDYVPAMAKTPVVADDLLLYFNGNALNALKLR